MFKFSLLCDANSETGIVEALLYYATKDFYKFIENQNYGVSLKGLCVIFMCRDPILNFKQRIRHSKKEQVLYMDIMLDYGQFVIMTHEQRVSELCKKLLSELPPIVKKYKFSDFDLELLENNLRQWFAKQNLII